MFAQPTKRIKRSVDLNEDTDLYIDRYRNLLKKQGVTASRGAVMDGVLTPLLSLTPAKALKIKQFIDRECAIEQNLLDSTPASDVFARNEHFHEVSALRGLSGVLETLSDGLTPEQPMRMIPMLGDTAILIPDDSENWIVANELDAPCADKATVVEIRNGAKYGMPHFIVFHNGDTTAKFIDETVGKVYPKYNSILSKRVEPRYDIEGNFLNMEEWNSSPSIGRFPVLPNNPISENPYGIEIIHTGGKEGSD